METSNPLLKRDNALSSAWAGAEPMSLQGVINKTGILLLLCMGTAGYGWTHPELRGPLMLVGILGGLVACLVGTFKPTTAPFAAPIYALLEGLALGCISQAIERSYPGIVLNAMLLTFGVLGLMLVLYTTRTIVVTDKLMKGVLVATGAVMLVYLADMVMHMLGVRVPFIHESGPVGIILSLVVVGIAAFNLLVDFAVIEDGVRRGSPRYMEWYCGMALLVTLVWLYLEILRLLAKMRGRD
ncbi:MAG TPA: Bax inhibitor-1/YccA family protein [Verrucomicrobiae bacterium]|nr:Bax inhibitor-1/YccA family protein [Verrucomicrobiae bacterium]